MIFIDFIDRDITTVYCLIDTSQSLSFFRLSELIIPNINAIKLLRAKFLWGNRNIYLHFYLFLHIDLTQVLKTRPPVREGSAYLI